VLGYNMTRCSAVSVQDTRYTMEQTDRQTDERQRQNCSSQRQQTVAWPVSCYQWPGLQSMCITSNTAFTDDKATTNGRSGKLQCSENSNVAISRAAGVRWQLQPRPDQTQTKLATREICLFEKLPRSKT